MVFRAHPVGTLACMGYRGKLVEREEARRLRAQSWTLADIAGWLGVSKSSVSGWVRDVAFVPSPRRTGARVRPHPFAVRKQAEIERLNAEGRATIGELSEREFLMAGLALYAGEGSKGDGKIVFANTDPALVRFFCLWLRRFFGVDEAKLRVRIYLHEGLDLDAATRFWRDVTGIPVAQFRSPYRAKPDPSIRHAKHVNGCVYVTYWSTTTHRQIMGLIRALITSPGSNPG